MISQIVTSTTSPYRSAGWAAIASGIIGIAAAGSLVAFLAKRSQDFDLAILAQRFHDAGVSIQFLLLIPVVVGLYRLSQQHPYGISKRTLYIGTAALSLTALSLLLIFPKIVSDGLYAFFQGVFGVWLIIINWRLAGLLSKPVRWFGMIVGFGLTLVGIFFVGYSIFVSPIHLRIPAASIEEIINIPLTPANVFLHYFIWIGSLMGVFPLPFWTILLGSRLLRQKSAWLK